MCGILGAVCDRSVDHGAFAVARDRMRDRGPDDAGSHHAPPVHFGARRLAIQDLSAAGHQPMRSDDGAVVVVFNGEIYNYPVLRRELSDWHRFRSRSDTEVLLHGYRAWGWDGLLRRLDGMFAIGLWDEATGVLHLARDRVGKKPLYWSGPSGGVYFASSLAALLPLLPQGPALDPAALDAYLVNQAVPAPSTVYRGVYQLLPAHHLRYAHREGTVRVESYWDVSYADKRAIAAEEAQVEIERLVRVAVRRRMLADVRVGTFLSGGVDSGLVTALLAQESGSAVDAVTLGFEESTWDERPEARAVASHLGVRLHEEVLAPSALQKLPSILACYGQPLGDISVVPTYFVAEAARRTMTVVLNGDGGDELFAGYARPLVAKAAEAYRARVPARGRAILGRLARLAPSPVNRVLVHGVVDARDAFRYDRGLRAARGLAYRPSFAAMVDRAATDRAAADHWDRAAGVDDVDRALYGDFKTYLPDQLLVKMDVATMAHSLEARSPLLDTALVEFAAQLPTAVRLPGWETKPLLKAVAARHIPPAVVYRRKRGFVMPAALWLSGPLAPQLRAALCAPGAVLHEFLEPAWLTARVDEHLARRRLRTEWLWTLLSLEVWLRLETGRLRADDPLDRVLEPRSEARGIAAGRGLALADLTARAPHPIRLNSPEPLRAHAPGMALVSAPRHVHVGASPMPAWPQTPAPSAMDVSARSQPASDLSSGARALRGLRALEIGMGWFPEDPGGLNRVFYQLVRHLPEECVAIQALVRPLAAPETGPGWQVARAGRVSRSLGEGGQRAAVRAALHASRFDLVASHFALSAWPALDLLRQRPLVAHFHGPWAQEGRTEGWGRVKGAAARHIERAVYRRAGRFIVLSDAFGAILQRDYGVDGARVHVVPGGVDADRFAIDQDRREARTRLGWPAERVIVIAVRRLVQRVGVEDFLIAAAEVAARVPDLWIAVVGDGPLRSDLARRAAELGLASRCLFTGRLAEADLPLAYRAADLSVVPSVALEGFGLVVAESLAAGTPVLVTPVGGMPEVVAALAPQCVCPAVGPRALAATLGDALHGKLPLPSPEACAQFARTHYDWPVVARGVRAVYDLACDGA